MKRIQTNTRKERRFIRVADIAVDPDYQRRLNDSWARKIADHFDPDLLGLISVGQRGSRYYVIDGQHRLAALKIIGYTDVEVECEVFVDTSKRGEARVFGGRNTVLGVRPFDRFRSDLTSGVPDAVEIARIVRACGLPLAEGGGSKGVACVQALRFVYAGSGMDEKRGPATLAAVLSAIFAAWGAEGQNYNSKVVEGLGLFLSKYGSAVELDDLSKRLARLPGGAAGLCGKGATLRSIKGGHLRVCIASCITDIYNAGRRSQKLEDWWK